MLYLGIEAIITKKTWGFSHVSQDTRYINLDANPIEFLIITFINLLIGGWLLANFREK